MQTQSDLHFSSGWFGGRGSWTRLKWGKDQLMKGQFLTTELKICFGMYLHPWEARLHPFYRGIPVPVLPKPDPQPWRIWVFQLGSLTQRVLLKESAELRFYLAEERFCTLSPKKGDPEKRWNIVVQHSCLVWASLRSRD